MRIAALLILLLPAQELPHKVKSLVQEVDGGEIEAADRALKALVELGPPALPAIEAERDRAAGDLKLRLDEVLKAIRRAEKLRSLLGETRVTLDLRDRPVREIIEALAKATGQPLDPAAAPPKSMSFTVRDEPFWSALEKLCRAHGGMSWDFLTDTAISFTGEPHPEAPSVARGDLRLVLPGWYGGVSASGTRQFMVDARIMATRGRRPDFAAFTIEELEDDRGEKLPAPVRGGTVIEPVFGSGTEAKPGLVLTDSIPLAMWLPHEKARKLVRLKGRATVRYVLSTRVVASVPLEALADSVTEAEGFRFHVAKTPLTRERPSVLTSFTPTDAFRPLLKELRFYLGDGKGRRLRGSVDRPVVVGSAEVKEGILAVAWTWPADFHPTHFEVHLPDDVETVEIPFDFRDLPLP